jgi:hypothetical protein
MSFRIRFPLQQHTGNSSHFHYQSLTSNMFWAKVSAAMMATKRGQSHCRGKAKQTTVVLKQYQSPSVLAVAAVGAYVFCADTVNCTGVPAGPKQEQ